MKNMNDGEERRSKNETWTKGGGLGVSKRSEFFFKDNNRGQK